MLSDTFRKGWEEGHEVGRKEGALINILFWLAVGFTMGALCGLFTQANWSSLRTQPRTEAALQEPRIVVPPED